MSAQLEIKELLASQKWIFNLTENSQQISFELKIKAKPGAKKPYLKLLEETLIVSISERAIEGGANLGIIAVLSEKFHVPKSNVGILRGDKGRDKRVQITMEETKSLPWKKRIETIKAFLLELNQ